MTLLELSVLRILHCRSGTEELSHIHSLTHCLYSANIWDQTLGCSTNNLVLWKTQYISYMHMIALICVVSYTERHLTFFQDTHRQIIGIENGISWIVLTPTRIFSETIDSFRLKSPLLAELVKAPSLLYGNLHWFKPTWGGELFADIQNQ